MSVRFPRRTSHSTGQTSAACSGFPNHAALSRLATCSVAACGRPERREPRLCATLGNMTSRYESKWPIVDGQLSRQPWRGAYGSFRQKDDQSPPAIPMGYILVRSAFGLIGRSETSLALARASAARSSSLALSVSFPATALATLSKRLASPRRSLAVRGSKFRREVISLCKPRITRAALRNSTVLGL